MNPLVSEFIEKVLSKVKYRKVHPMLAKELYDHVECIKEEYCGQGMEEEKAYQEAVRQMGEPERIGIELYEQHKPRMDWIVLLSIIGLLLMGGYVLTTSGRTESIIHMLIYTGAGIAGFIVCYFINYQKLEKHTLLFMIAGILVLLLTKRCGLTINGTTRNLNFGPLSVKTVVVVIPLFCIGIAGTMNQWNTITVRRKLVYCIGIVISLLLTLDNYMTEGMLLTAVIYITSIVEIQHYEKNSKSKKRKIGILLGAGLIGMIGCAIYLFMQSYRIELYHAWLNPGTHPSGYLFRNINCLLSHTEVFGDAGLAALDDSARSMFTFGIKNYAFLFIIGKLGIIGGVLTIGVFIALIVRGFHISAQHRNRYGNILMTLLCSFFAMQTFTGILTHLGLLPVSAVYIPYLSYDGSSNIFELSALGLFLGINRRKDILPNELID